jgi:type III pantothenate kinase
MILLVDIGNTNIVIGVCDGKVLRSHWRLETRRERTSDEYHLLVRQLLQSENITRQDIDGAILASVVPPLTRTIAMAVERSVGVRPLEVGPGIKTGMPILYDNPREVGADRIVNAIAAYEKVQQAVIVVDLGTATTFDAISARGDYLGGAIAPGIGISLEALFQRASKLPRVEIQPPPRVIGKNTIHSMQSGILYGYAGLVDGLVLRMKEELEGGCRVIATGGLAVLLSAVSSTIEEVDELLTLEGLRILYERNR